MDKLLYDLMDWAGIEELVYSESPDPHRILGASHGEWDVSAGVYSHGEEYYGEAFRNGKDVSHGDGRRGGLFCGSDSEEDFDGLHAAGVL